MRHTTLIANQPDATNHGGAGPEPRSSGMSEVVDALCRMSLRGLSRMYSKRDRMFVFRVRRTPDGIIQEGLSPRYTAITLLGLATLPDDVTTTVTGQHSTRDVCERLLEHVAHSNNLGDVALSLWAAGLLGHHDLGAAAVRLPVLRPLDHPHPVVELAWLLSALSEVPSANRGRLRDQVAQRLMSAFDPRSQLFPHTVGGPRSARSHVSCFADLIYPIQALSKYAKASGHEGALNMASACATRLCSLQGEAGQWWWHYDYRSGLVIERYPVYAIHQDAMGPMGLLALFEAGGPDFRKKIDRGLEWLVSAPELRGESLIDHTADLVWRKVARREPRKAVRYLQATASRIHPSGRIPAVDLVFPARMIDFEDRPYHLGWLLYAWAGRSSVMKATTLASRGPR
jgi:hypothetical protein